MRFLYFVDNANINLAYSDQDKLYKIKKVLNMIKERGLGVFHQEKMSVLMRALFSSRGD